MKKLPLQQAPVAMMKNNSTDDNPTPTPPATTTTTLKDGTYLGDETSSIYGKAQAQIVVTNGKITDVTFPEFPNSRTAKSKKQYGYDNN